MNWSQLVREGMRSTNACDPPNESFFLFNKRSVAVSSRQRGRCQLDMVNKLLIPAPLSPTGTLPLALAFDAPGREPMFKTLSQEAAALASLALFIAMIAIWTQVLENL
jgi:hypothetical protein